MPGPLTQCRSYLKMKALFLRFVLNFYFKQYLRIARMIIIHRHPNPVDFTISLANTEPDFFMKLEGLLFLIVRLFGNSVIIWKTSKPIFHICKP
jgi:hypothetical protein